MDRYNDSKIDRLIDNGYYFNFKNYLYSALELLKKNLINFTAYSATIILLAIVLSPLKAVGSIIFLLAIGPFLAGFYLTIRKINLGQVAKLSDFYQGFLNPSQPMFAYALVNLIVLMGSFLFLIPGIYFAVAFSFVLPFVVFKKMNVLTALETSRQLITKQWFEVFIFVLILGFLNVIGLLLWGLGLLISLPFSVIAIYFAYKDIIGFEINNSEENDSDINMNYFR